MALATILSYAQLVTALAARRRALRMTQLQVDFDSGLPDGYTGKIECGVRTLGNLSMDCLLGALGVEIVVVERETPETHDKSG